MAAKTTTMADNLLKLIFNATNWANIADNTATTPATNLYVSLHTGALTAGSVQTTNEAAYGGYSRIAVTRTSGGWTVTTNSVSPAATVTFPQSTSGAETESYFGVGLSATGAGALLYFGPISPVIPVTGASITPELSTSSMITEV